MENGEKINMVDFTRTLLKIPKRTCVLCGSYTSRRDIRDQVCDSCEKDKLIDKK